MLKAFCHDQIKLLLERMDSHPEEFIHGTKWNPYLPNTHHVTKGTTDYFSILNFAERNAIAHKFNKLCLTAMRQNAYNRVLEKMFESEVPSKWTVSGFTSDKSVVDSIVATTEIKQKKHKTLFGRLFV